MCVSVCVLSLYKLNHSNFLRWDVADSPSYGTGETLLFRLVIRGAISKIGQGPLCGGKGQGQADSLNVLGILSFSVGVFYENSLSFFNRLQQFYQPEQILQSDFPSVLDYT